MTHTLEIAGVTDDLLELLDDRVRRDQAANRAEYIINLLRRSLHADELSELYAQAAAHPPHSGMSFAEIVAPVQQEARLKDYTEEELNAFCVEAVKEARRERRLRRMAQDEAAA